MTDAQFRVLTACQGICLLLGAEAMMRIDDSLESVDVSDSHKQWVSKQRAKLLPLLEVLATDLENDP